ncbi:hypothetical protein PRJ_Dakar_00297 [Faustovirus]|nr:hypothetical protein PRJ_Dakar_00297 [Faustovirus]
MHWRDNQIDWKPLTAHYTVGYARALMTPQRKLFQLGKLMPKGNVKNNEINC